MKIETDHPVICLVLPECLSVKICGISPQDSEANRDGADAECPFPLFFHFNYLPHLRTLAHEKRSEICLCFGTVGPSLSLYPLLSLNIKFFLALTTAARAKKILAK